MKKSLTLALTIFATLLTISSAWALDAFSVKYVIDGDMVIYTTSADRNNKRLDLIKPDGTHDIYVVTYDSQTKEYRGYVHENGGWEDSLAAIRKCGEFTLWSSLHLYYKDAGFTKGKKVKILGQDCTVWSGVQKNTRVRYAGLTLDKPAEIAVLDNTLTMRLKSDNKVVVEAKAISLQVPESAFTQSADTSWIKGNTD